MADNGGVKGLCKVTLINTSVTNQFIWEIKTNC